MYRRDSDEYEWRPGWAQRAGALPSGRLAGADRRTIWLLRHSITQRDAEACKRFLGQLPQTVDNRRQQDQQDVPPQRRATAQWEMIIPPYFRVAHEAVCGDKGVFADADISVLDMVRFLHTNGAPMDTQDADGRTPLWIAADLCELDVMRYLLTECGASANTRDLGGWTPLNAAVQRCNVEAVSMLVEDGKADVNTTDEQGYTPLHAMAGMGRLDMIQLLRHYGAEVDIKSEDGQTALHAMVKGMWNHNRHAKDFDKCCDVLDGVKFLTGPLCQANVNVFDNFGKTPLLTCLQNSWYSDKLKVMHYLHDQCGADICVASDGGTALHAAVCKGLLGEVRYLMEKGVNPQLTDYEGDTPLHRIADEMILQRGEKLLPLLEIARFLTSDECSSLSPHGFRADINARNDQGTTPLLQLLSNYRDAVEIIKPLRLLLDELGADLGLSDNNGDTALHVSACYGRNWTCLDQNKYPFNPIVLDELLKKGVVVEARNNEGLTPLHAVINSPNSDEVVIDHVCFLCSNGASIRTVGNNGRTPLHTAAALGKIKVVKALVEMGAELDIPDENGLSALQLAELRLRKSRELPEDYHWWSDAQLHERFYPVVKYLRSVGSSAPTWWTSSNLVGRILCKKSQGALERFANETICNASSDTKARRPHVSHIVHAQRVLEASSIHGIEIEDKIRNLISGGDLLGAIEALTQITVKKATLKHKHCSICSELLCDEESNVEETGTDAQQKNTEETSYTPPSPNDEVVANEEKVSEEEVIKEAQEEETDVSSHKAQILCCPNSHPFHAGCLADLILGGNFRCPVCRARVPVAAATDMHSLVNDLERTMGKGSLFPQQPQTVDETLAAVDDHARKISYDVENSVPGLICRDLLVRARDELLRDGKIDGSLLVRGPLSLRAYSLSSRQFFGIQDDEANDDEANDDEANNDDDDGTDEDKEQEEDTQKPTVTFPLFAACVGFGRGVLDPRVQQSMLAGDLARIKLARENAQQSLIELRTDKKLTGDYTEDEEEEEEDPDYFSGDDYEQSSISMRKAQTKMRKQRAKKDRRLRFDEATTPVANSTASDIAMPLFLARRELSVESEQAIKSLRGDQGDIETNDGSTIADASRGHRYLELAAPVAGAKEEQLPIHVQSINSQSKAALREAVSEGDVDSAARHLRRSRISAHVENASRSAHGAIGPIREDIPVVNGILADSSSKGGTKKQRKRRAQLRRRKMILDEADSLGHPVCCCCDEMVTSALLKPLSDPTNSVNSALSVQLAAESLAERHASCVNGHAMHASCFSKLITSALPCPLCNELLILPPVVQRGGDDCCGGGIDDGGDQDPGEGAILDAQLDTRLDYMALSGLLFVDEGEYGSYTGHDDGDHNDPLEDLRQCPGCNLGPVFNKDCADLNYHHGECQRCGTRTVSRKKLDEIVASKLKEQRIKGRKKLSEMEDSDLENPENELSVPEALPDCKICLSQGIKSKLWYNGCMGCGMSFSSIPWDSLPPYEPPPEMCGGADNKTKERMPLRRVYTDRVRRERRVIRLVASLQDQLHNEIVALMHEARAVEDEKRRRATKM